MHILIKKLHCFFSQKDHNLVGYIWKTFKVILKMVYKYSCIWNEEVTQKLPLAHIQFRSVAQWCPTLCESMDWSTPGFPVHHQLPEPVQTHVHWVSDVIQASHLLLSPFPPAFNFSQHQGLFQWVSSSHQVAKVLEFYLQHQSFQWVFRTDLL